MRATTLPSLLAGMLVMTAGGKIPCQVDRHLYTFSGDGPDALFGEAIASVGDVDGDEVPDIAVGAPQDSTHGNRTGICRVFSGRDGRVLLTLLPAIPGHVKLQGEHFGCAVAGAGDVDGDKRADLIVGAWGYSTSTTSRLGCAQVFSGRTGRALFTFFGSNAEDYFGSAVAGDKDVDGDGLPDFAVGATETRQAAAPGPGYVAVFSGLNGQRIWRLASSRSTNGKGAFGQSVALADVNRDLRADVIVGSPYDTHTVTEAGSVYAFSGRTGQQMWVLSRAVYSDHLGWSVAAVGDLDQDGVPDVVAGGPNASPGAGVVLAIASSTPSILHTWTGAPGDALGTSVAGAGDVDGDKVHDVIAGSWPMTKPGFADVYSGATGKPVFRVDGSFLTDEFEIARVVAGAGDVNRDGFADVIVGAPGSANATRPGRAHVYSGRELAMTAFGHEASLSRLGTVELRLFASGYGGKPYFLLGSMSGTSPGIQLGTLTLPLNPINDTYFLLTLSYPNTLLLADSLGTLDGTGRARARFRAMPELPRSLVGRTVHHAFVVFGSKPFDLASNAVGIRFTE